MQKTQTRQAVNFLIDHWWDDENKMVNNWFIFVLSIDHRDLRRTLYDRNKTEYKMEKEEKKNEKPWESFEVEIDRDR